MIRDNLPVFVTKIREMDRLISAEQPELDGLESDAAKMLDEFRVDKTDKLIRLWEDFLGFPEKPAWAIERRRERLKSRLFSTGQLTISRLKEIIEQIGGVAVELEELYDDCVIIIHFVGDVGIPKYLDDIKRNWS